MPIILVISRMIGWSPVTSEKNKIFLKFKFAENTFHF
jgi:hypothetical protein